MVPNLGYHRQPPTRLGRGLYNLLRRAADVVAAARGLYNNAQTKLLMLLSSKIQGRHTDTFSINIIVGTQFEMR